MCGIAGILNKNSEADLSALKKMLGVLNKRGPDGSGTFIHDKVALGHARLSIIDLSELANQPMKNKSGSVVITFNGEIYNYRVLKNELSKTHEFISNSDTEVLLAGYENWGIEKLLQKIDGMYAFTLVDLKSKKAFACRDIFGKKPFYYHLNSDEFIFSSDIRSFKYTNISLSLNKSCIDYYLTELSSPQPFTIYNQILQLPPASHLELDLESFDSHIKTNWSVDAISANESMNEELALSTTEELLFKAVEKRLVSDVPVCSFLSGGADSGLVTSLFAQLSKKKIDTYTIGFNYSDYSEIGFAKQLAAKYGTDHHEFILEPNIINDFDLILEHFGEPFADSSSIPSYYISKEMGKHCKVALSGDGGDEIFGGYYEYEWAYKTDCFFHKYPNPLTRETVTTLNKIFYKLGLSEKNVGLYDYYNKLLPELKMYRQMGFNPLTEKKALYQSNYNSGQSEFTLNYLSDKWNHTPGNSLTTKVFKSFTKTRLLNDYLVKVDRSSMMNSLEIRSPFLDKDLSEFAFTIPNNIKLKNGTPKYILKKLAEKHIDKDFFKRKKMGFSIPLQHWINKELKPFVDDTLSEEKIKRRGMFNYEFISSLLQDHRSGKSNNTDKIWALVVLEHWLKKNVD